MEDRRIVYGMKRRKWLNLAGRRAER